MRTINSMKSGALSTTLKSFKRGVLIFSTTIMLSSVAIPTQAVTVYKYVKDGIVTYSQLPPEDINDVEVIELLHDGRRSDVGQMAGKTSSEDAQEAPPSDEEQRIAELEKQMEEQRAKEIAEQCQRRRYDLTNLNSGGRVYELDENGQKKFLDNRQVEQKREKLQAAINEYCS